MLSHVHIGITDFPRAFAFYSAVMKSLGLRLKFSEPEKLWAGWMPASEERPLFLIGSPYNGQRAAPGNGQMVALLAPTRNAVQECYAVAIANGGRSEGPPGLRPQYHPNYYGAHFQFHASCRELDDLHLPWTNDALPELLLRIIAAGETTKVDFKRMLPLGNSDERGKRQR